MTIISKTNNICDLIQIIHHNFFFLHLNEKMFTLLENLFKILFAIDKKSKKRKSIYLLS